MEKLRRLDIAQGYVELLAEVDKLRYGLSMVLRRLGNEQVLTRWKAPTLAGTSKLLLKLPYSLTCNCRTLPKLSRQRSPPPRVLHLILWTMLRVQQQSYGSR